MRTTGKQDEPVRIAIKDASILIDMEDAALLDLWFLLGIETHTSDFVAAELDEVRHPTSLAYIREGLIICHELSGDDMQQVVLLKAEVGRGLSLQDCSTLFLAARLGESALLTGDNALRRVALQRGHEVHGLLWVFDRLVEGGLITPRTAASKLAGLIAGGSRLPLAECESRIKAWRGEW